MPMSAPKAFSETVSVFLDRRLPVEGKPCGYAALIDAYDLRAPAPTQLFAIGLRHKLIATDEWRIVTPRHEPMATLEGHLTFALKYEGVDLGVLGRGANHRERQRVRRRQRRRGLDARI